MQMKPQFSFCWQQNITAIIKKESSPFPRSRIFSILDLYSFQIFFLGGRIWTATLRVYKVFVKSHILELINFATNKYFTGNTQQRDCGTPKMAPYYL